MVAIYKQAHTQSFVTIHRMVTFWDFENRKWIYAS